MPLMQIALTAENTYRNAGFGWQTHCVVDLYKSRLGAYDAGKTKKIVIELTEARTSKSIFEPGQSLGITHTLQRFNFHEYWKSKNPRHVLLDALHQGMMYCATNMSWDCQTLVALHDELKQTNLEYWAAWGKPSWNLDRTTQIKLVTHLTEENCEFYCDLQRDKFKTLIPITKTKPSALYYSDYIGKLSWVGTREFVLTPKNATIPPIIVDIADYLTPHIKLNP
jgi:hypothetical protein